MLYERYMEHSGVNIGVGISHHPVDTMTFFGVPLRY